jgi:hypothetical protein
MMIDRAGRPETPPAAAASTALLAVRPALAPDRASGRSSEQAKRSATFVHQATPAPPAVARKKVRREA